MKRAFTILELVIVMAIIAILSEVLIPSIVNGADNAKQEIIDITGETAGGTIVLQYMPHELVGNYFTAV